MMRKRPHLARHFSKPVDQRRTLFSPYPCLPKDVDAATLGSQEENASPSPNASQMGRIKHVQCRHLHSCFCNLGPGLVMVLSDLDV